MVYTFEFVCFFPRNDSAKTSTMRNPLVVHTPWDKIACIPKIQNLFLLLKLQLQIVQMKTHPCKRDDAMSAAKCGKLILAYNRVANTCPSR